jgi:hypothetical protein
VVTQIKEGKRGAQEQVLNKWKKKNLSMDTWVILDRRWADRCLGRSVTDIKRTKWPSGQIIVSFYFWASKNL